MSGQTWYYFQDGTQVGPVDFETLRDLARRRLLKPTDQVWREGFSAWRNAGDIEGLPFQSLQKPAGTERRPGAKGPPRMDQNSAETHSARQTTLAGTVAAISGALGFTIYAILAATLFFQTNRPPIFDVLLGLDLVIAIACAALAALSIGLLAGNPRLTSLTGGICLCLTIAPLLCTALLILTPASPVLHLPNILLVAASAVINFTAGRDPQR